MAVRHVALATGAALLLGLAVYLFVEVRTQPTPPQVDHAIRRARPAAPGSAPAASAGEPNFATRSPDRPAPAAGVPSAPTGSTAPAVPPAHASGPAADEEPATTGPKLEAAMDEANKAYDRGDYEDAKALAGRLLAKLPTNVRMLRIMVSASCIDGDLAVAQAHYAKLPPADQAQMRVRCARYGVTFTDHP